MSVFMYRALSTVILRYMTPRFTSRIPYLVY